ncbi:hypothetical protein [Janibacter sp. Soil728]|uniref:hypothetical protein n=1 Tax=Janibacter sp. Soil728 TaxID=1736393 RepID=UPI000AA32A43|nr:hypothetical protein [Janibacter sp. Soil728]
MTRWRVAPGIAWVAAEPERVALIDTRDPMAQPMHVQAPFAALWAALADGPVTQAGLEVIAADIVDEGEAADFVASFVESLGVVGAVEQVTA